MKAVEARICRSTPDFVWVGFLRLCRSKCQLYRPKGPYAKDFKFWGKGAESFKTKAISIELKYSQVVNSGIFQFPRFACCCSNHVTGLVCSRTIETDNNIDQIVL